MLFMRSLLVGIILFAAGEGWVDEPALPGAEVRRTSEMLRTIVVDPGHGGWDHGTVSAGGIKEKDLVLSISKHLAKKLSRTFGAKVILTRTGDAYVPLPKRTTIANDAHADLFLSIHANSSPKRRIRGLEVYYLSEIPSDDDAQQTAQTENRAGGSEDMAYMSDLQKTLLDLVQTGYIEGSRLLAEKVVSGIELTSREKMRGIKHANFWVLNFAEMPAVLVEVGYLSNDREARELHLSSTQEDICSGILMGLEEFRKVWTGTAAKGKGEETTVGTHGQE